jgi:opacity protein-like surface antigen
MKKLLLTALIAGMSATPALASTPYVSGSIGLGFVGNSEASVSGKTIKDAITYKSGIPFGAAVGMKKDQLRVEAAIGYQTSDVDKEKRNLTDLVSVSGDSVSILTYMANCYYDINLNKSSVSPYVMAGIGGASINAKVNTSDETKSVFAWQLGAGVGVKAANNLTVDLGYRYLKASKFKDNYGEYTASSSNILAGVRYDF